MVGYNYIFFGILTVSAIIGSVISLLSIRGAYAYNELLIIFLPIQCPNID
jgi:hypothetical protein